MPRKLKCRVQNYWEVGENISLHAIEIMYTISTIWVSKNFLNWQRLGLQSTRKTRNGEKEEKEDWEQIVSGGLGSGKLWKILLSDHWQPSPPTRYASKLPSQTSRTETCFLKSVMMCFLQPNSLHVYKDDSPIKSSGGYSQ